MMNCPRCGKEIPSDSQFCSYCGGYLPKQTPRAATDEGGDPVAALPEYHPVLDNPVFTVGLKIAAVFAALAFVFILLVSVTGFDPAQMLYMFGE